MLNMCNWTSLVFFLGLIFGHVQVEAVQDVFHDELNGLRKIVQENTEIIRLLTEKLTTQNGQIQNLETKLAKSEEERITLAERIEVLESFAVRGGLKSNEAETPTDHFNAASKIDAGTDIAESETYKSVIRRAATNVIAFYAYMGQTEVHPGPHHTIIFDVPVTNIGNGYNHFSGIFSVPSSGVYVFSWTIGDSSGGSIFTELVVNKDVVGGILTQSMYTADRFTTTGLVVKEVSESDVVYVRTSPTGGIHGDIQSLSPVQRTSFSGWRLA